jgi:bifunctional ADP-heptose synthase (sugar kinase/adenylyltransferase)/beta-phosphoglucomutase-like phosphatase (HAD superfamily)
MMDSTDLRTLLESFSGLTVGVVGDFCLDVYWEMDNTLREVSLETGLDSTAVRVERMTPGGASNVAVNLASVGVGSVMAFGAVGRDPYAGELVALLQSAGVDTSGMRTAEPWHTHMFIKSLTGGVEGPRIDVGNYNSLCNSDADAVLAGLAEGLPTLDALIVNQQVIPAATIHTDYFRAELRKLIAKKLCDHVVVDSRDYADEFPGTVRKMNDSEVLAYSRRAGLADGETGSSETLAGLLAGKWETPLVVTRGDRETLVVSQGSCDRIPAVSHAGTPLDTVGAGDSFVASLSAAIGAGAAISDAAHLGNLTSGVTITKIGVTGVATPPEIIGLQEAGNWVVRPDLADAVDSASYLEGSELELAGEFVSRGRITHALFDHDGTISTLREGWEAVMEPMMMRSIAGGRRSEIPPAAWKQITRRVNEFIEDTTGVQTLAQMKGLVRLVRDYGYVEEADVLDEHGYKEVYNTALLERVDRRLDKLARGELGVADFTMAGAVEFVNELHKRGVRLYLVSGTDQADVEHEAEALGYAGLFDGGIHGAVGSLAKEAKREVLARIIAELGDESASIAVFGDGPVEMRAAARINGFAVGVASDELRRFGLNTVKRRRLIRAGAHVIAPDFTQRDVLLSWMESKGLL